MHHHLVLRVIAKLLIPAIILYGLYVQFHGEYSPGGGFQAGVIIAAALILYGLIFGLTDMLRAVPLSSLRALMAIGVLIYAATGIAGMLAGGNYLNYDLPFQGGTYAQVYGIMIVEVGVGLTVGTVMTALYAAFAGRNPSIRDSDW